MTIAQQLGLDLTTVANFFMNARRRGVERHRTGGGGGGGGNGGGRLGGDLSSEDGGSSGCRLFDEASSMCGGAGGTETGRAGSSDADDVDEDEALFGSPYSDSATGAAGDLHHHHHHLNHHQQGPPPIFHEL